jgi:gliding motility-associated-like protein
MLNEREFKVRFNAKLLYLAITLFILGSVNAQSPGGVAGPLIWIKADAGTSSTTNGAAISQWSDQSGNTNHVVQATGANQPTYQNNTTNNINFNPVINFDGSNDNMQDANGIFGASTYTNAALFAVALTDVVQNSAIFHEPLGAGGQATLHTPWGDGNLYWDGPMTNSRVSLAWGGTVGVPYIWTGYNGNGNATKSLVRRDGLQLVTDADPVTYTGNSSILYIGSQVGANYFDGKIAEEVFYTTALTVTDVNKIESYLAIKYGKTLSQSSAQNYVNSAGTSIYTATTTPASFYITNVAGIARDDASGLNQKVSKSTSATADIFTMSLDNDFTSSSNALSRTTSFSSDLSAIVWGNDNAATTFNTTFNTSVNYRMARQWYVQKTNCNDQVYIQFTDGDIANSAGYVLIGNTTTDNNAWTVLASATASVSGNTIVFGPVDIGSNVYLSIANQMASTISSNAIAAATVCATSTKYPIQSFSMATNAGYCSTSRSINGFNFTTTGTFAASDISKYQFWYNTTNNLSSATQLGSDKTPTGGNGTTETFAGISQALSASTTYYFWITADIASTPTNAVTIKGSAITSSNLIIGCGYVSGSASAAGTHTLSTSSSQATVEAAGSNVILNTETLTLTGAGIGGSAASGAWSVASSSPAAGGAHTLSSTAQTAFPHTVTFTPYGGYNGTVTLALTANGGCQSSTTPTYSDTRTIVVLGKTFTYTGGTQTYTVPTCITSFSVQAWGAGGGAGGGDGGSYLGGNGGGGAYAGAIYSATGGDQLTIVVGGGGSSGYYDNNWQGGGVSGWGNTSLRGGAGGASGSCCGAPAAAGNGGGGGGGGASAVYNTTANTTLVIAGGGGAGGGAAAPYSGAAGGGGGANGSNGSGNYASNAWGGTAGASGSGAGANGVGTWGSVGGGGGGGGGINGGSGGNIAATGNGGQQSGAGGGGGGNSSTYAGTSSVITNGSGTTCGNSANAAGYAGGGTGSNYTGTNGGNGYVKIIPIFTHPVATITPGSNITACQGITTTITSGASVSNNTSFVWYTTNGSGTLSNPTDISNATYTPTAADAARGYVLIHLMSIQSCGSDYVASTKTITVLPAIAGSVSSAQSVCAGALPNVLTSSPSGGSGSYTYVWQSSTTSSTSGFATATGTATNATYTPGTQTQDTWYNCVFSSTFGCTSYTTAAVKLTHVSLSVLNTTLTPDSICTGSTFTYTPNSAAGGATFAWKRAAVAGILTATNSGTGAISEVLTNTTNAVINTTYSYTTTANGCSNAGENVVLEVNPVASVTLTSAVGTDNQFKCFNDAITDIEYTFNEVVTSASLLGAPAGLIPLFNSNKLTLSGTPSVEGAFVYTVTSTGICTQTSTTGTITIGITQDVTAGNDTQTVCKNQAIIPIKYNVGSGNASISGMPAGISGSYSSGVYTVSGTATQEGTFNYTVTTTGCSTNTAQTGLIVVGLGKDNTSGDTVQAVCRNQALDTIRLNVVGGATPTITFTPNQPTGVDTMYIASTNTLKIFGTPSVEGEYFYNVTAKGSCATASSLTGRFTVGLGKARTSGDTVQVVCKNQALDTIRLNVVGGATPTITFTPNQPTGLDTMYVASSNMLKIFGTPTVEGEYFYNVTAQGSCAAASSLTGRFTIGIGKSRASGDTVQAVCKNQALDTIRLNLVGGATPTITFTPNQPMGVDTMYIASTNTLKIFGTPTVEGEFFYNVTAQGSCAQPSSLTGKFTIGIGKSSTSGDTVQAVCKNQALDTIRLNVVGGATPTITFTPNKPTGVDTMYVASSNMLKIFGTPTVEGEYFYNVTAQGSCAAASSLTGKFTIGIGKSRTSGDTVQTVCRTQAIDTIRLNVVGGATPTITFTPNQPTGVDTMYIASTNTLKIFGTPSVEGEYFYNVTAQGSCAAASSLTGKFTIGIGKSRTSGDTVQAVCKNQALDTIRLNLVGGATPTITFTPNQPMGVDTMYIASTNTLKIFGIPSVEGEYFYNVTAQGSCAAGSSLTGKFTIGIGKSRTSGDTVQAVCKNQALDTIRLNVVGGATPTITYTPNKPVGVDTMYIASTNTLKIFGTPTVEGEYFYNVMAQGSCSVASSLTGRFTVGVGKASTSGDTVQAVCRSQAIDTIRLNVVGGATPTITYTPNKPVGVDTMYIASTNTLKIFGTATVEGEYFYNVMAQGSCSVASSLTGRFTIGVGKARTSGDTVQAVCLSQAIDTIRLNVVGGATPTITYTPNKPTGVDAIYIASTSTLKIFGTPTVEGEYFYNVTAQGSCSVASSLTGRFTVGVGKARTSGDTVQSVCRSQAIDTIRLNVVGGATPTITYTPNKPAGVDTMYIASTNTLKIFGTPTVEGEYFYNVTAQGSCATASSLTGRFTVGVGKARTSGDTVQSVCRSQAIDTIRLNVVGGAAPSISFTPNKPVGIDTMYIASTNTLKIFGTPTVEGEYFYNVTAQGSCSVASSLTGRFTVGVGKARTSGDTVQSVCRTQAIDTIRLNVVGGAAPFITFTPNKPAGVDTMYIASTNTLKIFGTPTVEGIYRYNVTSAGSCDSTSTLAGKLTVGMGDVVGGNNNQTICIGESITTINYYLPGFVSSVDTAGFPAGLVAQKIGNAFVIAGTPTVSGTYNYTVTAISTCATASKMMGRIIINRDSLAISSGNDFQILCLNKAIETIQFNVSGTGTGAALKPLSTGLTGSFSAGVYTVLGTPAPVAGIYTYSVSTTGSTCPQGVATKTFTIHILNPIADFTVNQNFGIAPLLVEFNNTSNADATVYSWNFNDGKTSVSENTSNLYSTAGSFNPTLIASYNGLCPDTATLNIIATKTIMPNVFSPNNDGQNELFTVVSEFITNIEGEIYNSWGNKVYEWSASGGGWDGRDANTNMECPAGTYFYILKLTYINETIITEKGAVLLVR